MLNPKATQIEPGLWEVLNVGACYKYRTRTNKRGGKWSILRIPRGHRKPMDKWEEVEDDFNTRASAIEFIIELADIDDDEMIQLSKDIIDSDNNPVSDLINNIDDDITLDGRVDKGLTE